MDINERKARIQKWASVGLIALVGLAVSPIIFLAIKGIIGLAIAAVVGLTVVTFTPYVSMKLANWRVKAIMHEAGENPIETMMNLLAAKRQAFNQFKANVEDATAARDTFKTKCLAFAKKYPERADEFNKQLQMMSVLVERKKDALVDAQASLEEGQIKLEEMKAYWDMSQAAQQANLAAGMDTGDLYEKLKADTAVDAVFTSMNRAFAQLEVAAALEESQSLEYNPSEAFDVTISNKQKVSM